jgi:hypothetical protein
MGKTLIFFALLALAGCQTAKGSFCTIASPIRPSTETIAVMTDAEVRALLAHNRKGVALCGWKA